VTWIVDTCVLIDIALADPKFGESSMRSLERHSGEGLAISPVSLIEIAPVFDGKIEELNQFIDFLGLNPLWSWQSTETMRAMEGWSEYVLQKRKNGAGKRVVADFLIRAFAERQGGLITRNPKDFRAYFPKLKIIDPSHER